MKKLILILLSLLLIGCNYPKEYVGYKNIIKEEDKRAFIDDFISLDYNANPEKKYNASSNISRAYKTLFDIYSVSCIGIFVQNSYFDMASFIPYNQCNERQKLKCKIKYNSKWE